LSNAPREIWTVVAGIAHPLIRLPTEAVTLNRLSAETWLPGDGAWALLCARVEAIEHRTWCGAERRGPKGVGLAEACKHGSRPYERRA
jgi:hypothetical protein